MKHDRMIAVRNNKTVFRDGDRCLKVFREAYSKAEVLQEALNQARVEQTGLRVPALHEVSVVDGHWTIISEFIKGKTLAECLRTKPEDLTRFVALQVRMHNTPCHGLSALREELRRHIGESELSATERFDLYARLEEMPREQRLCHGDFDPSNVVITADDEAYILDWSKATLGSAAADAARSYLLLRLSGEDALAEHYLELYCSQASCEKQLIRRWLPIVAAAHTKRANAQERTLLYRWIRCAEHKEEKQ